MAHTITTNEIIADLQSRGYHHLFNVQEESIYCNDYVIGFEDFDIIETHTLKNTLTGECYIIYGISCDKFHIKGIISNQHNLYIKEFISVCLGKIVNNDTNRFKYHSEN